jgi:hypothetical protein
LIRIALALKQRRLPIPCCHCCASKDHVFLASPLQFEGHCSRRLFHSLIRCPFSLVARLSKIAYSENGNDHQMTSNLDQHVVSRSRTKEHSVVGIFLSKELSPSNANRAASGLMDPLHSYRRPPESCARVTSRLWFSSSVFREPPI